MGKLRSLTTDEILVQLYYANKVCRVVNNILNAQNDDDNHIADNDNILPKVDNIVFMGMGEPADNADAVVPAVNTMVDRRMWDWLQPIRLFPIRAQSASFLLSSATGAQRHASSWRHVKNLALSDPRASPPGDPISFLNPSSIVGISISTYT